MNPNSSHQTWSKWVFVVFPGKTMYRDFKDIVANCARFGRKGFSSASQMRVQHKGSNYIIEVLTESAPIQEPKFVEYMRECWTKFFVNGFGPDTKVSMTAKLMAGEPGMGGPAAQMIILPTIKAGNDL